jgi:hypothetical protein
MLTLSPSFAIIRLTAKEAHSVRTKASWEEQQQAIDAAKILAKFANLEPDGVDGFRKDYPTFISQAWWDYRPTLPYAPYAPSPKMQWQINQRLLRDAWMFEFHMDLGRYVHLLTSVFDPNEPEPPLTERRIRPAYVAGLDIGYEMEEDLPYYRAVKWLSGHGDHAKTCKECGQRFIGENSNAKFCPPVDGTSPCFLASRKRDKDKNWNENKARINEQRRQEYQKSRKAKQAKQKRQK